ncbi:MAG TPA: hypothetical protein V6D20_16420, partial [Candidatus Obscuribacterales bacterium]
ERPRALGADIWMINIDEEVVEDWTVTNGGEGWRRDPVQRVICSLVHDSRFSENLSLYHKEVLQQPSRGLGTPKFLMLRAAPLQQNVEILNDALFLLLYRPSGSSTAVPSSPPQTVESVLVNIIGPDLYQSLDGSNSRPNSTSFAGTPGHNFKKVGGAQVPPATSARTISNAVFSEAMKTSSRNLR